MRTIYGSSAERVNQQFPVNKHFEVQFNVDFVKFGGINLQHCNLLFL